MSTLSLKDVPPVDDSQAVAYSKVEGPPIIDAAATDVRTVVASPEILFRSISLVLADNATSESRFISDFFGRPAEAAPASGVSVSDKSWDVLSRDGGSLSFASATPSVMDDAASTADESASVITTSELTGTGLHPREKRDRSKRAVADSVWKQVMAPSLEYCQNFIGTLLDPAPSAISTLSMIRLNDALFASLITEERCARPEMEAYLMGLRLQLWPLFNRDLSNQLESVRKLTASAGASAGLFGGKPAGIKDAVIQKVRPERPNRAILSEAPCRSCSATLPCSLPSSTSARKRTTRWSSPSAFGSVEHPSLG